MKKKTKMIKQKRKTRKKIRKRRIKVSICSINVGKIHTLKIISVIILKLIKLCRRNTIELCRRNGKQCRPSDQTAPSRIEVWSLFYLVICFTL